MRSLGTTLTAAQKAYGYPLYKIVFSKTSSTSQGFASNISNRILRITHPESEWSQTAQILLDRGINTALTTDLTGWTATIYYGYYTAVSRSIWVKNTAYAVGNVVTPTTVNGYQYRCTVAGTSHATTEPTWGTALGVTQTDGSVTWELDGLTGDEYSGCAPLEVIGQKADTLYRQGQLVTSYSCAGVFNMMGEDEASAEYAPDDTNTDTVKTILTAIANATMACFSHCKNYTITFDSEDSLIDTFKPADYFRVNFKESRLSAFKKALGWTKCKARIENTSAVATIHVFDPADGVSHYISGTTYNYEYNDAVTYHNFFEKSVRNRLVIPNRVYVLSHPDHSPQYTSSVNDSTSYTALGRYVDQFHWLRLTSTAQATAIATAILQRYQIGQEIGHGVAPINCGQEVMDYIKITDSVANDTRTGNIGYLNRTCEPGKFEFEFRFGDLEMGGIAGLIPTTVSDASATMGDRVNELAGIYNTLANLITNLIDNQSVMDSNLRTLWDRTTIPYLHVTDVMMIPVHLPGKPKVTTQDVSSIAATTATGNFTIVSLGLTNPTACGVCWVAGATPSIADSKTDEGTITEVGALTTNMLGLTTATTYNVRAYAQNTIGTSYGEVVSFTTL